MKQIKTPAQLAVPNDLQDAGRRAIADSLNPLVADAFSLYIKTKNYHWHLCGSHFRDYHLLFDEQAAQIFEMIDLLAERVRMLGKTTIRSIGHIGRLTHIKDDDEDFVSPASMLKSLMEDNKHVATCMRAAHAICAKYNDVATTSNLEIFIHETEKRVWFLFEMLSNSSSQS